ncbi:MAG TPA: autotransporter-associated beta strand repeat-containing protein, partial [Thermoanaerobaculia bacterium]|nr:autotransporter-associated beta strand repeat-containing protein [Thermoanaerobaculia bacterium]
MKLRRVVALVLFFGAFSATAGTKTWSGTVSSSWNVAGNWQELAIPLSGDALVFPIGALTPTTSNNLAAGNVYVSITFQGSGFVVSGNALQLSGGVTTTNTTGTNAIQQGVTFTSAGPNIKVASGGALTFASSVTLGAGSSLDFQVDGDATMGGPISGSAAIVKDGPGALTLSGNNTYTGTTTVNAGTLVATIGTALGSPATGTQVASGATLQLQGGITSTEPLSIAGFGVGNAGALLSASGTNTYSGPITLTGTGSNYVGVSAGTLTIDGVISSPPATTTPITKVGAGTLALSGANTYSGNTTVLVGDVSVQNPSALGDLAFPTVVAFGAALDIQGGIDVAEPLSINGLGIGASPQGALRSVSGGNAVTGSVTLQSDAAIGVDSGSVFIIQGNVDGSGFLRKVGLGQLILSGTNSYTGQTRVNVGVLRAQSGAALGDPTTGTIVSGGAALELQGNINIGNESLDLAGTGVA